MDIRSILVNVDVGNPKSTSLGYAIDLAQKFGAELIGVAADQPNPIYMGIDSGGVAIDAYAAERQAIEDKLNDAGNAFAATVPGNIAHTWRAFVTSPTVAILESAHLCDLIVTSSTTTGTSGDKQRVDLGELALGAGRPILDVAASATRASFDRIVIGWKDTREARRAVVDALPFLKLAHDVTALTVSEGDEAREQESLAGLAAWLDVHGIAARTDLLHDQQKLGDLLQVTASELKADLLVTGAYGHTRMREWLFGGVTRDILRTESLNRLLSN